MAKRRSLKIIHFSSTALFVLSVGYLFVLALRQGGAQWWLIFSLSGISAVVAFILVSVYLFAMYRGVVRSQQPSVEHPLSSSAYYMIFYDIAPFLGAAGGMIGMFGTVDWAEYFLVVAYNTLFSTFFVWILLDPVIGLLEYILPASRFHRAERLSVAKAERAEKHRVQQQMLASLQAKAANEEAHWKKVLGPEAVRLVGLVSAYQSDHREAEAEAVDMGVRAWQTGGLNCMQQLYRMAAEACKPECSTEQLEIDYISDWWDGIGGWRSEMFGAPKAV